MSSEELQHVPVMMEEVCELLRPRVGTTLVDGTLGLGGHSERFLQCGASVIGFDRDTVALGRARARLAAFGDRIRYVEAPFAELSSHISEPVDGILVDLGVSSLQLGDAARGFSFMHDGPLDMRMGSSGPTAAEKIADAEERELADVIYHLGEERSSFAIARGLKRTLPQTTAEVVRIVERAVPRRAWPSRVHVATKTFQALRMWVNDELGQLETLLAAVPALLKPGGVAAMMSFHSLEDRMVKRAFLALAKPANAEPGFCLKTKKPLTPTREEVEANPRARSAKLRALQRVDDGGSNADCSA